MKPFNLKKALEGEYCVTRDGRKAKLLLDKRTLDGETSENEYPILGIHQYLDGAWGASEVWTIEGRIRINKESRLDIIGMWEEEQPKVTITIPAPLKVAINEQEVWYVSGNEIFKLYFLENQYHSEMLEGGQLFKTKEDCLEYLSVMEKARR